jgi:NADPH-dependent 2,4-dienoyl-CoA reductase/sulfur reductase-like enzyme/nitrite reductase/ring-hydroxylating ferredoxin subunit
MEDFTGPDFGNGFPVDRLPDGGMIQGKINGEDVILARTGGEFFAVGAGCTHYHGPLIKGLIVGDQLRCPLHHACFSLRTGEALRAPAFDPIPCWRVERIDNTVFVREKLSTLVRKSAFAATNAQKPPASVVIVGGGAAGLAAAEMLRREGYDESVTMISADDFAPYDRPNVSKDYLAGPIPDEWMPLRLPKYYAEQRIDLILRSRVSALDVRQKQVQVESGKIFPFGALLLATGAEPVTLTVPGASDSQLYYVRTFADSRKLVEKAASAKRAAVVGSSFIGLEVAASLRTRGIDVHVVAPEKLPLERVLGSEVGQFIRALHEAHGVVFHLGETVTRLDGQRATLSSGTTLDADFLVLGVGVRPSLSLAEQAGLKVDRGVAVNEYLETSAPGIFAAGDIARWPDAHSGQLVRIEHWVVAERQGQVAARNILGHREKFDAVPFFWSQHYDVVINYVGHAEGWDKVQIEGSLEARDCAVSYKRGNRTLAVATISRDLQSLRYEATMESGQMQP